MHCFVIYRKLGAFPHTLIPSYPHSLIPSFPHTLFPSYRNSSHRVFAPRISEIAFLCAELTSNCNALALHWLSTLKAMCLSSHENNGYTQLLCEINVSASRRTTWSLIIRWEPMFIKSLSIDLSSRWSCIHQLI